jgi:hypothetical protein
MKTYVPWSLKDATLALEKRVAATRNELLTGGSAPPPVVDSGGDGTTPDVPDTPQPPAVDRDKAAMDAFKHARGLMQAGKELEALDGLLAFLVDWKGTEPYVKYGDEVKARIKTLAARPAGVIRLFRGVAEEREKGRFRISYDFETEDQLLDFRDENAFEAPPRANWKCISGAMQAKGSGAFVLDAKFDQEFLSVSVKVSPQRAHDLGVAFFEHDDIQRFYLFTLQNSFFALGKGPDAKPFQENSIVLFGRDMWRDTAPGLIGFVRKCGSDAPEIKPGESLTIKVAKADAEVWMRFPGGRTIRGSASGDKPYTFHGLEAAVFVLNSSGFFDEFVVEGTPDPEWVAQRWQDRLSKL